MLTLCGHTYTIGHVAILPDGRRLVSCGDNTIRIWEIATGSCEATFTADSTLWACAYTPDGSVIVAGDLAGQMHFLEFVGSNSH